MTRFTPLKLHLLVFCLALAAASPPAVASDFVEVAPPAAPGAIAPSLTANADTVFATWVEAAPADGEPSRVRFARFSNGVWGEAVTIAESADILVNWADFPSAAVAPDGSLYAHWPQFSPLATEETPYAYDVHLARSTDGGAIWSAMGTAHDDGTPTEHGFVSFASRGDALYMVWLDGRGMASEPPGPQTIRGGRVTADGVIDSEVIDERVCDCCQTGAAAGDGGLVVAYRDRSDGQAEVRDIWYARHDTAWSTPTRLADDGWEIAGCPVNGPRVAADGSRVAIGWHSEPGEAPRVQLALSHDGGASFGAPILVDDENPVGRVELVANLDDSQTICWLAAGETGEKARILCARYDASGEEIGRLQVAETGRARAAGFPRAARYGDGLLVAWVHPATEDRPSRIRAAIVPDAGFETAAAAPDAVWSCAMHPHITGDDEAKCEICGMDMLPLETPR